MLQINLLDTFSLSIDDDRVEIAPTGQRVLALLMLRGGEAHRAQLAGTLWPDQTDQRALANLRSAVWRLPQRLSEFVCSRGLTLRTAQTWTCDVDRIHELAEQATPKITAKDRLLLSLDLLPQWDEPWLVMMREQHRQQRLHLIEDAATTELESHSPLDAVDTVLLAVAHDPLRESAQRILLKAHLQAGNRHEALEQYDRFEKLLRRELDVSPGPVMRDLALQARSGNPSTNSPNSAETNSATSA